MKKVEYNKYGPPEVLEIKNADKPVPGDNDILIKIHATTVTATECTFRSGEPIVARLFTGLIRPKINTLGEELAGEVESVGKSVKSYQAGDQVFGTAGPEFGANAEYICLPDDAVLMPKPSSVSYQEAAGTCDGYLTAIPFLRDTGNIKKGQKVLIIGASGSVGSSAVQYARYVGAEVTGVCSTANVEMVRSLGAAEVIDYRKEDFTGNGKTYDIIFDAVGKTSFSKCKKSLTPNGIFLEASITMSVIPYVLLTSVAGQKKAKITATGLRKPHERKKDLKLVSELIESGEIKPVIDREYKLDDIAEAHRYVETGRKRGNVVVSI